MKYSYVSLARLTNVPVEELKIVSNTLLSTLGLDSIVLSTIRGKLYPTPTFQVMQGMTISQIVERMDKGNEYVLRHNRPTEVEHKKKELKTKYPLSPMQESYLFGMNNNCPCIVYSEIDITDLQIDVFKKALVKIINNEPLLNTRIIDEIFQCVEIKNEIDSTYFGQETETVNDLEARRVECSNTLKRDYNKYWDVQFTKIDTQTTRLHISVNMLFVDATSLMILYKRVVDEYNNILEGSTSNIKDNNRKPMFFEYCETIRQVEPSVSSIDYWNNLKSNFTSHPQLPKKSHELTETVNFERKSSSLDGIYWQKIKKIASKLSVTPNSLLIASFYEALKLYSETSNFTIAITQSERPSTIDKDFVDVIGEFTNVILFSSKVQSGIIDLSKEVNQYLIESFDYKDIDGISYIRSLREFHNTPHLAFPVVFTSFVGIVNFEQGLNGASSKIVYQQTQTPQISLDCQVIELGGDLIINWDYNSEVYNGDIIQEILSNNLHILKQLATNQTHSIGKLHPDIRSQRSSINMTKANYKDKDLLLHELFLKKAKEQPTNIAIIDQEVKITYEELYNLAVDIATKLKLHGVESGDIVAILITKSWKQVASALGILFAGAVYVPIDSKYPQPRINKLIKLSGSKVVILDDLTESLVKDSDITQIICPSKPQPNQAIHIPTELVSPDSLAYIIFTSGSTGEPKGVKISHRGAVNTCISINEKFKICEPVTFGISALNFDLSVWDIFGTFYSGGILVICKQDGEKDPDYWWKQILEHKITVWNTVPTSFEMLLLAKPNQIKEITLESVLLSGDAIRTEMIKDAVSVFTNTNIIALGGATEASIWSNYHIVTDDTFNLNTYLIPYGKPLPNQTMFVLDKDFNYTPSGVIGNIYIGGIGLAMGYLNSPTLTNEKFINEKKLGRIYDTGDIGRYLPNGEIEIIGRSDNQVKILGYRIEIGEIENCIKEVEGVKHAIVIYNKEQRDKLIGFIVSENYDYEHLKQKVYLHATQNLPDYMIPRNWHFLDKLPLTQNNKVNYKRLHEMAKKNTPINRENSHEQNASDDYLSQILETTAKILNISKNVLSPTTSLIEQGLTSLYSVMLINELRTLWQVDIPYTSVFNFPTAKLLSEFASNLIQDDKVSLDESNEKIFIPKNEPIAVIAYAYRLPNGITNSGEFKDMMYGGIDCVSEVPKSRFNIEEIYNPSQGALGKSYTKQGAFMSEVNSFDYEFFGIPLSEAKIMDPQQRMLLEVAYEACHSAGYDKESLKGKNVGVFIGQMNYDWMMDFPYSRDYASTGVAPSISSNRISYVLGLTGPSMTVDTACSSSLVAVDLAVNKLQSGDCDVAIVGGINIMLSQESYIFTSQARMLSPNSRCATFDEAADGIARGEGVGIVVLKRVNDAINDKNVIAALVVGTAVNQDGRSASLTAPNGLAQEKVIARALQKANLSGGQIDYMECHGTGTSLGDPIEIEALSKVLGKDRKDALVLGSIKTNIGHLEGAAGIMGFIKTIEVLKQRIAPKLLHLKAINSKIDILDFNVIFPKKKTALKQTGTLHAGVSSFGFGGTNAHVILQSVAYSNHVDTVHDVWIFSGQGSIKSGMVKDRYESNSIFRNALDKNIKILSELLEAPLLDWLLNESQENTLELQKTQFQQPAIVAVQLAQLEYLNLHSTPSYVLGHSIGEISAAVAIGILSVESALKLTVLRGNFMGRCNPGGMAAVLASEKDLVNLPNEIAIAAENGEKSIVISGPTSVLKKYLESNFKYAHKFLNVSHAFHSPMMEEARDLFTTTLKTMVFSPKTKDIKFISTMTGEIENEQLLSPKYWGDQIVNPVRFKKGIETLFKQGNISNVIEVSPSLVLTNMAKKINNDQDINWLSIDTILEEKYKTQINYKKTIVPWGSPINRYPKVGKETTTNITDFTTSTTSDYSYQIDWRKHFFDVSASSASQRTLVFSREQLELNTDDQIFRHMVLTSPISTESVLPVLNDSDWNTFCYVSKGELEDLYTSLELIKLFITNHSLRHKKIVFVTDINSVEDSGIWGLVRSTRVEYPTLKLKTIASSRQHLQKALHISQIETEEPEFQLTEEGNYTIPRLKTFKPQTTEDVTAKIKEEGVYVITGGTGGLGIVAAEFLVEKGAKNIILLSRTPHTKEALPAGIKKLYGKAQIQHLSCDVSNEKDVEYVRTCLESQGYTTVAGIIHTAGILSDGLLINQNREKFKKVISVKYDGAVNLFNILQPSDFLLLYSSAAAVLGTMAQSSYAAANGMLDSYARDLRGKGHNVKSIQWGVWSEVGMAVENNAVERVVSQGFGKIDNQMGKETLNHLIFEETTPEVCVCPIDWERLTIKNILLSELKETTTSTTEQQETKEQNHENWNIKKVYNLIRDSFIKFTGSKNFDEEVSFMESGLSSLDLVEFRKSILEQLPYDIEIPLHFAFNYPTIQDIAEYIHDKLILLQPKTVSNKKLDAWKKLNDIEDGVPVFLIGGVMGNEDKTYGSLAKALSLPVYATTPAIPSEIPNGMSIPSIVIDLIAEISKICPRKKCIIGGMSFGGTLAIEAAMQLEKRNLLKQLVLLDPRHLSPFKAPIDAAPFELLVERYSPNFTLKSPSVLFQCKIPPFEQQSEMMREASRSFQKNETILNSLINIIPNVEIITTTGHHFNFLYKHYHGIAEYLNNKHLLQINTTQIDSVAIIGMSCRTPGNVNSPKELYNMMMNETNGISHVPKTRFNIEEVYDPTPGTIGKSYTKEGGFMSEVDSFDYEFFGISLGEAKVMDPQQRLLLEVAYEACHDAGYSKETLKGQNIGVFIGQANDDWKLAGDEMSHNPYFAAGTSNSITSNRISYIFGLSGPSITVDTACSSSLVALDLAVNKLQNGDCDIAIVGGVNVMLDKRMFISACSTRALSPKGRCATFDEAADGYCRGEGVGVVVLKKASDAVTDNNSILAIIRGTAVNQDGHSATLTAPNGLAQEKVITKALKRAGVIGKQIDYVECHGTGTPLGDPIEIEALKNILGKDRNHPLVLGATKSNIGHLEGAAGIVGLIKTVTILKHRSAPKILHLKNINSEINTNGFDVVFPKQVTPLKKEGNLLAGVSSFGFGGTNAHVILESYQNGNSKRPPKFSFMRKNISSFPKFPNPLINTTVTENFETTIPPFLSEEWLDHEINGEAIVPASCFITLLGGLRFMNLCRGVETNYKGIELGDMTFRAPLTVNTNVLIKYLSNNSKLNIVSEYESKEQTHAESNMGKLLDEVPRERGIKTQLAIVKSNWDVINLEEKYRILNLQGVHFGVKYKNIKVLYAKGQEAYGQIELFAAATFKDKNLSMLHPTLLDAGLQLLGFLSFEKYGVSIPFHIAKSKLFILKEQPSVLWASASIKSFTSHGLIGDVKFISESGEVYAILEDITCKRISLKPLLSKTPNLPTENESKHTAKTTSQRVSRNRHNIITIIKEMVYESIGSSVNEEDSLMEKGLDSLNAVLLAQNLSSKLGLSLDNIFVINYPTVNQMATEISKMLNVEENNKATDESTYSLNDDAIAIVGMACRTPGGVKSPEDLFNILISGKDGVHEVPASRFDIEEVYDPNPGIVGKTYTKKGGFMSNVESFDYDFFGISPGEAKVMDPQQRLLLEVAYEACYNAGYNKETLKGQNVGVFIGQANDDWKLVSDTLSHNPYFGVGVSDSITSNRISYSLGLVGASMTIDTACSSSLVALDLAVNKLQNGDCDLAIVGGVNVMLHPRTFIGSCAAKMLSIKGRCATFDASADGYCRGEGVGVVVLKRAEDAIEKGDFISAIIKATAVNQDGRSATLTAPNGVAQEKVISEALKRAKLKGNQIDYVECHGTGTPLGDPIEVWALKKVLGKERKHAVVLGSVKSNIGHLEGAAGIIGLIKTVEVLKHRTAPKILHLKEINPKINLTDFDAIFPKQTTPLKTSGTLYAGVSSFGFGGTNTHVILESYPAKKKKKMPKLTFDSKHIPLINYNNVVERQMKTNGNSLLKEIPVNTHDKVPKMPSYSRQSIVTILKDLVFEAIGVSVNEEDSLMEKGLDSLNAVLLAQNLSTKLELSLDNIFVINYPTVAEMTTEISRMLNDKEPKANRKESLPSLKDNSIAIVGMACRAPGEVDSPEDLFNLLVVGKDGVHEVPKSRFDIETVYNPSRGAVGKTYTKRGGFMSNVESFDYDFFGISLSEAKVMDPQQRLLLEVAYEACHDAGYKKEELKGLSVGVFIGQMNYDWSHMKEEALIDDPYFGAGAAASITSNRISYTLGLTGPSITVDTACSSSLVAVDLAVNKLQNGDCDIAIVGGVNVMLHPRTFVGGCAANMLSIKGRCASFDESADGYCRGEGVGVVILKRTEDAIEKGDSISAVVRATAVNQDGRSAILTAPNGGAQENVISKALKRAGLNGNQIDYVECHGTGTPLGDPIEIGALKNVLGKERKYPLVVGTIKANIGHLEGAAGVMGLINAVEVLKHRVAPKILHLEHINPKINLSGFHVTFPKQSVPLRKAGTLYAGVSSFGFGGTNAHVILESYE